MGRPVLRPGEEDGSLHRFPPTASAFASSYPMILESSQHRHHQPLGLSLWSGSSGIVLPSSDSNSSSSKTSGNIGQSSHFEHDREGAHGSLGKMIMSVAKGSGKSKTNARDPEMQGLTNKHSSGAAIRMCSNCNTTKTPLWRSGPWGPKSLCNACGIRQRKAKHTMEVAAAVAIGSGKNPRSKPCKVLKEKKREESCILPFKKRFKITNL